MKWQNEILTEEMYRARGQQKQRRDKFLSEIASPIFLIDDRNSPYVQGFDLFQWVKFQGRNQMLILQ